MEQHDRSIAMVHRPAHDPFGDGFRRRAWAPLVRLDVPPDMAIPEPCERVDNGLVIGSGAEGAAEPWPRISTGCAANRPLGGSHVRPEAGARQERHAGVVVGVASHQVPVRDSPGQVGMGLRPTALEEEGGRHLLALQDLHDLRGAPVAGRAVGMFGVEGERDAERCGYFSTPVITTPRTKARWKIRKMMTGTIKVSSVPAWIKPGSCADRLALNWARPTASVWSSGLVDR
jgi:hypothetical protein